MLKDKLVDYRIEPYIQETVLQLVVDIVVLAISVIVSVFAKIPWFICLIFLVGYVVVALFLHYKVVIEAITDKRKKDSITETVRVVSFVSEFSFAGDSLGHSNIRFFYPKEIHVCKYKIKVIDSRGEEKKLRSVMSFRRSLQFALLEKQQIAYLKVTYLKRSKILIGVELVEELNTKSKKKKEMVEKALRYINTSI